MSHAIAELPVPPPVETSRAGTFAFIDSSWRHQGMVGLTWRPAASSPFWSHRGLSILVGAMLGAGRHDRDRGALEAMEHMGVHSRVVEDEFGCKLQLTGEHDALRACVSQVEAAIGRERIPPAALSEAVRAYTHRQRARRAGRTASAERRRWRAFVGTPERLWRDLADLEGHDLRETVERAGTDYPRGFDGAVAVGGGPVAAAWLDSAGWSGSGPAGVELTGPARAPGRYHLIRPGRTGQAFVAYGAVRRSVTLPEYFAQELAIEILAGWPGAVLNLLLREKLALTYGVTATSRIFAPGDARIVTWSVDLVTADADAPAVCRRIAAQVDELIEHPWSADEIVRAGRRTIRRSQVLRDSVAGIMALDGHAAFEGLAGLAVDRRRYLDRVAAADVTAELIRMRREGIFTIVGSGPEGAEGEDVDL
jgi:hypothetical protein